MCAELSPAREAVLSRHRELSIGQLRRGIGALEMVEAVLGELLQILEIGTIRQGHDAPSFLVPGVRGVGRKVVMSIYLAGGFNPSRGPSAAWTALAESTSVRRRVKRKRSLRLAAAGESRKGGPARSGSSIGLAAGGSKRSR